MEHVDMLGLHSNNPNRCVCNGTYQSGRGPRSVMYTRKTTNHAKHILWGFLTGGVWWFTGYPVCVLLNRRARSVTVVR